MSTDRLDEAVALLKEAQERLCWMCCIIGTPTIHHALCAKISALLRTPATPPPASCAPAASEAVAYHKLAPPRPREVECVCGEYRPCGESWWLVERRDVQPPEWLVFTGATPAEWSDNAWRAQRWSESNRLDAIHTAEALASALGVKVEAISHGFVGGERVIAQTRCDECGSDFVRQLPHDTHPTPRAEAVVGAADGCPDGYGQRLAARCVNGPETERMIEGAWGDGYIAGQRAAVRKYRASKETT